MRFSCLFVGVILSSTLMAGACHSTPPAHPHAATPPAPSNELLVSGAGVTTPTFTLADLGALPRHTVTITEKDGPVATYEGVTVQDILTAAGMEFGHSIRGPRLRDYLVATGSDGYAVVFALPEISTEFSDRVVLVADRFNGGPVGDEAGPLRLVVSDEHKHARWVRNLVSVTVESATTDR